MSETRKRPQRAAASKNKNPSKFDGLSELDSEIDSESEELKPQRKARPPKKKAKTTASDAPTGTVSTGRRKCLSKLLEMPLDILYEVCSIESTGLWGIDLSLDIQCLASEGHSQSFSDKPYV